ncbi:MAG: glycosyltransferase family 2 protein [Ruminococcaceae bacterium]|nr:glycosyltransferase family 2 protein [Oscillospiraceae bacterium]
MLLSLVVPCYNEEGNVRQLFDEVNRAFAARSEEIEFVFVDDGSTDKTCARLSEIYTENPTAKIQVISFSRNFGKEAAMYAGLKNATGDAVCIIDADLQQRPAVVCEMLDEMAKDGDIDCVCAFQKERNEGKLLRFFKACFYKIITKMSEIDFKNGASDFRLMKRTMVDAIVSMAEYHRFSKGLFSWVGFNTKYIPYRAAERNAGRTKWSFRKLVKYAVNGIIAFSTAPLRIATYIGFGTSFLSLLYLIAVIIEKIAFGIEVKGYPTLVVLILFIGGTQLFFMGIIGEYIAKMYVQVKNRPIYIEKKHLR